MNPYIVAKKILYNFKDYHCELPSSYIFQYGLGGAFSWRSVPEGFDFWRSVNDKYDLSTPESLMRFLKKYLFYTKKTTCIKIIDYTYEEKDYRVREEG